MLAVLLFGSIFGNAKVANIIYLVDSTVSSSQPSKVNGPLFRRVLAGAQKKCKHHLQNSIRLKEQEKKLFCLITMAKRFGAASRAQVGALTILPSFRHGLRMGAESARPPESRTLGRVPVVMR